MERRRQVPGEGPLGALLVLIGEAGGAEEAAQGRPFVGPTGKVLEEILAETGLHRRDIRIDNVIQRHPPGNKLESIPKDEKLWWIADLHERLDRLHPKVIVGLGGLALEAITSKKSISNWRGSILQYKGINGHGSTFIPMFHPAFTFKDPIVKLSLARDFKRAVAVLNGTLERPKRKYHIRPTIEEVELYASLACNLDARHLLTLDIETPGHIACVGFSFDPSEAISVPTSRQFWKTSELVQRAWRAVRDMCQSAVPKVLQHGLYDAYWLRRIARIEINNWLWDLMCMHHCVHAQEPHNLAYMTSMYRDWYVFWKTEAKDPEAVQRYARDIDALYTYNCMDCCEQRGLFDPLYEEMSERGVLDFYDWHYRKLMPHMLDLMCRGFRVNGRSRAIRAAKSKAECIQIQDELAVLAGTKVHATKSLSRKVLVKLLYEQLKLPKRYGEGGSLTTDIFTLQRFTHKYPKKMGVIGPLVMTHRKAERLASFLDPKKIDLDGRMRSSYGFDPVTGRFSSGKNPMGTGDNAQNQDLRVRDTFLPDEGKLLLKVDMSQAESRVIDVLTLHPFHIERAHAMPWEGDVHRSIAAMVFGKDPKDVTDHERYICKRAKYAGCYDITGQELSRQFTKEAIFIEPAQCQKYIDKAIEAPIRDWQARTRAKVMRDQVLGNSWGWTIDFGGMRLDRETYKRAYAFNPQSEIGFQMHHWGFWAASVHAKEYGAAVNAHVHDELVSSVSCDERAYEYMVFLRSQLERPRRYSSAGPLVIPCTWGLGTTWKVEREWKQFPSKEEFMEAVKELSNGTT